MKNQSIQETVKENKLCASLDIPPETGKAVASVPIEWFVKVEEVLPCKVWYYLQFQACTGDLGV